MQTPNWSDIEVFLAVYRGGSLTAAGKSLGVYASTVGRRLTTLEQTLGAVLFQRASDGLVPTTAADEMRAAAEQMERQMQLITARLSGEEAQLAGPVRIAVTVDLANDFLLEELADFRRRHPEIRLHTLSSAGLADLAHGAADLAVRFAKAAVGAPVPPADIDVLLARQAGTVGFGLYASPAYVAQCGAPPAADRLGGCDIVFPSRKWLPGHEWMTHHGAEANVTIETDSLAGARAAAQAGFGLVVLPHFVAARYDLVRVDPDRVIGERVVWLVYPRDLRRVARVRAVLAFIEERLRASEVMTRQGVLP